MKKLIFLFLLIIMNTVVSKNHELKQSLDISISGAQQIKMPLLLISVGDNVEVTKIAEQLKRDFSFSDQFDVAVKTLPQSPTKKEIIQLSTQGYFLAVFINKTTDNVVECRVYDTMQVHMVQGKKYQKRGPLLREWAHNIADMIWPVLTGQEGCFSSKIAYCKESKNSAGVSLKHICIADYDGSNEHVLVDVPTITIAPRWNKDIKNPLVFYSEYTNTNVCLMAVDMNKKRCVASDFDGINMLPAFSEDGKSVIYCATRGDGNCQLYHYRDGELKRITHNIGNNISPSFSSNANMVYFCSDFQTGFPQIYACNMGKNTMRRITKGGYCASPSYCPKRKQIAYTKMIHGVMQIMFYDEKTKKHQQVTSNQGNKQECSWSPCGNYLLYSIEQNGKSRLARLNALTNKHVIVTAYNRNCCYPAWSPCYRSFPAIKA